MCLHQSLARQTQQPAQAVGRHPHHSVTVTVTIAIAIASSAPGLRHPAIGLYPRVGRMGRARSGCDAPSQCAVRA